MRRPGIEPGPPAWQASILPLNHRRVPCRTHSTHKTAFHRTSPPTSHNFIGYSHCCRRSYWRVFLPITPLMHRLQYLHNC
uniref:Uncharacterized protein n=1 Tax=Mesocestoides corti TaxID=53468 RepID=A0A5K3G8C2_MESCO